MTYLTALESALKSEGAGQFAAKVLAVAKPGVLLRKQFKVITTEQPPLLGLIKRKPKTARQGLPVAPGKSRVGGLPDLPTGYIWPSLDGKPLQFLAQINCAEITQYREHTLLPPDGVLHFFFEEDGSESRVTLTGAEVPLQTTAAPAGTRPGFVLSQFSVEFIQFPTLPHSDAREFAALGLSEADAETVLNAQGMVVENIRREEHALHQIGGYPEAVQGDVFTECEMIARRNMASSDQKLWEQAADAAHHWRLLFQFDTDGDMNVMWGDAGTIYFCIREDDLRAGRFDMVCSTAQCF